MSNPSLILPQSPAYGEDYVYAAQVEDGAVPLYNVLPLTFTRASGGTRINKDGLVQNMPYNLLEYSEDLSNGVWIKYAATSVIANTTTAPNGTTTADTISTSGIDVIRENVTLVSNSVNTYSIYVKKINYDYFGFQNLVNGTGAKSVFNLSNGTVTTQASGHTASIESVGNGWYRCIVTFNCGSSSSNIFDLSADGTSATLRTFYAWGAQLNIGSTAQPYLATTDRLNMPRITYPVGGGCGALLLEKQSTNIVTYSEDFTNWTTGFGALSPNAVTANYGISPDGTQNADRIQLTINASNTVSQIYQFPSSSATTYTASVWLKSLSGTPTVAIVDSYNITGGYQLVTLTTAWVRHTVTFGASSGGIIPQFLLLYGTTSNSADFLAWGFQLEASSYATSYIPTTSTSATRIADACYKTGISNLIGQTEGTMFVDVAEEAKDNNARYMFLSDGSFSNRIVIYQAGGEINVYCSAGSSFNISYSPPAGRLKIAVAYKSNDYALYVNGVQRATVTTESAVPSGLNSTGLSSNEGTIGTPEPLNTSVNQAILYKTRLTNAELATLTTI